MPILREEHPGLRQKQMQDMLHKQFEKSPENPFNQVNVVAYDADREDVRGHIDTRKQQIADRLRTSDKND